MSINVIRNRVWALVMATAVVVCATATDLVGANITLAWDPNPDPSIAGYKVYYGPSSGTYPFVVDTGKITTQAINNLQEGVTYYFAVTAYTVAGLESDFSGEIVYAVPLRSINDLGDGSFRIRFQGVPGHTYRIQYTESLTAPNWRDLGNSMADANGSFQIIDRPPVGSPARFYRSVYPAR